jgi:antitoxin component HigA of HigAB toxin-antitoxin module
MAIISVGPAIEELGHCEAEFADILGSHSRASEVLGGSLAEVTHLHLESVRILTHQFKQPTAPGSFSCVAAAGAAP